MEDVLIVISFKSRLFPSTVLKLFKVVDNSLMAEQLEVFVLSNVCVRDGVKILLGISTKTVFDLFALALPL